MNKTIACPLIAMGEKCLNGQKRHYIGSATLKRCQQAAAQKGASKSKGQLKAASFGAAQKEEPANKEEAPAPEPVAANAQMSESQSVMHDCARALFVNKAKATWLKDQKDELREVILGWGPGSHTYGGVKISVSETRTLDSKKAEKDFPPGEYAELYESAPVSRSNIPEWHDAAKDESILKAGTPRVDMRVVDANKAYLIYGDETDFSGLLEGHKEADPEDREAVARKWSAIKVAEKKVKSEADEIKVQVRDSFLPDSTDMSHDTEAGGGELFDDVGIVISNPTLLDKKAFMEAYPESSSPDLYERKINSKSFKEHVEDHDEYMKISPRVT